MSVLSSEPLIMNTLTDQAMMSVLNQLEGQTDISQALLVCRWWSKLLQGDAAFQEKAKRWREDAIEQEMEASKRYSRCYDYSYSYGWGGYGSC